MKKTISEVKNCQHEVTSLSQTKCNLCGKPINEIVAEMPDKTISEAELLKEFEHDFGAFAIMGKAGRLYNGAFANEARISDAKSFISKAFKAGYEAGKSEERIVAYEDGFKAGENTALEWVEKELIGEDENYPKDKGGWAIYKYDEDSAERNRFRAKQRQLLKQRKIE